MCTERTAHAFKPDTKRVDPRERIPRGGYAGPRARFRAGAPPSPTAICPAHKLRVRAGAGGNSIFYRLEIIDELLFFLYEFVELVDECEDFIKGFVQL